jgi:hypothetical protein
MLLEKERNIFEERMHPTINRRGDLLPFIQALKKTIKHLSSYPIT